MKKFFCLGLLIIFLIIISLSGFSASNLGEKELVIVIPQEPETLDPIGLTSGGGQTLSMHVLETLAYIDEEGGLNPLLAETWEPSEDGLIWTIKLREGVSFTDGDPFNAEAVKFNLERIKDPDNSVMNAYLIKDISEVEVVDEYTVRLHMIKSFAPIIRHLANPFLGIISPSSVKDLNKGETANMPIGTSPYKLVKWEHGMQIILEKNENYWGGPPKIDKLIFKIVPEAASRVIMLETGEADIGLNIPVTSYEQLKANPEINVTTYSDGRIMFVGMNNSRPPFDNKKVRQAFSYAIDKEAILKNVLFDIGTVASAPIAHNVFGYKKVGPSVYDPEKAKKLLAETGYEKDREVILFVPLGAFSMTETICEAIQSMLRDIGVKVTLETMEFGSFMRAIRVPPEKSKADMFYIGWGNDTLDADYGLFNILHSDRWPPNGGNLYYYKNNRVDELIELGREISEPNKRKEIYSEALEIIWDDVPALFMFEEEKIGASRVEVTGVEYVLDWVRVWNADKK